VVISADGLKGMGGEAGLWKLPGLAQTPAGRHKQLLTIDDMALLGFGRARRRRCSRCGKKRSSCPDAPCPRPSFAGDDAAAGLLTLFATTLGAMRCR
jgi:iron complex transport system substrate-binding protein